MSEKKEAGSRKTAENYYDLKTDAVDRLVDASNAPEVSYKEINKYKSRKGLTVPSWLKILFIKFWFSGAICYFFMWGLGLYMSGIDLIAVLVLALGLSTDLLVNNLLHYFEPEKGAYNKWMMVPFRKFWSVFLNVPYAGLLLFFVIQTYGFINIMLVGSENVSESIAVGVEPLLFGLLYMGFDMLFILIKNTMIKVFRDANEKVSGGKQVRK